MPLIYSSCYFFYLSPRFTFILVYSFYCYFELSPSALPFTFLIFSLPFILWLFLFFLLDNRIPDRHLYSLNESIKNILYIIKISLRNAVLRELITYICSISAP